MFQGAGLRVYLSLYKTSRKRRKAFDRETFHSPDDAELGSRRRSYAAKLLPITNLDDMNISRIVIAAVFVLYALVAIAQRPENISLLRAIGSIQYSPEPSGRIEAINNLGVPFLKVEGHNATIFRQIGEDSLIQTVYFKGGPNAEYDVSFSKESCVSLSNLQSAYGVQPRREMIPIHVQDMKGGFLRGVPVWVIEFPRAENKQRWATGWLSKDERCAESLSFSSKPFIND